MPFAEMGLTSGPGAGKSGWMKTLTCCSELFCTIAEATRDFATWL
jgi:hypothetical protein